MIASINEHLLQCNLQQVVFLIGRDPKGVFNPGCKSDRHGFGMIVSLAGGLDAHSYLMLSRGNPHGVGFAALDSSKNHRMGLLFTLQRLAVNQSTVGPD